MDTEQDDLETAEVPERDEFADGSDDFLLPEFDPEEALGEDVEDDIEED